MAVVDLSTYPSTDVQAALTVRRMIHPLVNYVLQSDTGTSNADTRSQVADMFFRFRNYGSDAFLTPDTWGTTQSEVVANARTVLRKVARLYGDISNAGREACDQQMAYAWARVESSTSLELGAITMTNTGEVITAPEGDIIEITVNPDDFRGSFIYWNVVGGNVGGVSKELLDTQGHPITGPTVHIRARTELDGSTISPRAVRTNVDGFRDQVIGAGYTVTVTEPVTVEAAGTEFRNVVQVLPTVSKSELELLLKDQLVAVLDGTLDLNTAITERGGNPLT